jgi:hypothetical protein
LRPRSWESSVDRVRQPRLEHIVSFGDALRVSSQAAFLEKIGIDVSNVPIITRDQSDLRSLIPICSSRLPNV